MRIDGGILSCATGTTETTLDFRVERGTYVNSVQIREQTTYPMYVRIEYYWDENDQYPEILKTKWLKSTLGHESTHSIVLNKPVEDEKGKLRVSILNESGVTLTPRIFVNTTTKDLPQQESYNFQEDHGLWAYNQMIERHTDGGAIEVDFIPVAGSWFELESMKITAGMTAAEDFTITVQDGAGLVLKTISVINTQAGTWEVPILATSEEDNTASTASSLGKLKDTLRISYPCTLNITSSVCSATDDITVLMLCKIKDRIPTITFTGNTALQAGYASAYSKTI